MSRSEWNASKRFEGTVYGVVLDDAGSMDYYDTEEEARKWADGAPIMTVTMKLLPYEKK